MYLPAIMKVIQEEHPSREVSSRGNLNISKTAVRSPGPVLLVKYKLSTLFSNAITLH